MKTSDLIEILKTSDFTDEQGYNLIVNDLFEMVPQEEIEAAQRLVAYFRYKIQNVCFPAIRQVKEGANASH